MKLSKKPLFSLIANQIEYSHQTAQVPINKKNSKDIKWIIYSKIVLLPVHQHHHYTTRDAIFIQTDIQIEFVFNTHNSHTYSMHLKQFQQVLISSCFFFLTCWCYKIAFWMCYECGFILYESVIMCILHSFTPNE